ncbi:MAG TPA: winged helix-turn-helix domain-containing protein [Planctomycetota bacterium]|nr:winged helix-turn-helix domain-containing protein [Planctomycetota bacterium]
MEHAASSERRLERIVKGFANHRRIQMMRLLEKREGLSLMEVCKVLHVGLKAGSEHMRKLVLAGLVAKRNHGRWVRHRLTPSAPHVLSLLRTLERQASSEAATAGAGTML